MKRRACGSGLVVGVLSLGGLVGCDAETSSPEEAVDRWIARHREGWTLVVEGDETVDGAARWARECGPQEEFGAIEYLTPDTWIEVGVRCEKLESETSAASFQRAFQYIALDTLPSGITYPGWTFDVMTATSSVREGVSFVEVDNRRLVVSVSTDLYAVWGNSEDPACDPPADGGYPDGCWLQVAHAVPLELTVDVPFDSPGE